MLQLRFDWYINSGIYMYQFTLEHRSTLLFSDVVVVCGFEQKFWWIDGFGEKRHGSADLHTPIHPLHKLYDVLDYIF